jgi:Zn-dependent protease with chaperone function
LTQSWAKRSAAVLSRRAWRRADMALACLVLLATLAAWLALMLSASGWVPLLALAVTMSGRTLDEALAHTAELGRLSLLLPLGFGLFLATVEGARLTRATRRLIGTLDQARRRPTSRLRRPAARCGLRKVAVLVSTDRPVVFTHGLFHARIWLSTGLMQRLNDAELEAVLRHEGHHCQPHDPLKIFAVRCLSRALFYIPVARDLCDTYCVAKEIAADEQAAQAMGDARPLASALHKLIAQPAVSAPVAAMAGESHLIEAQLLSLLDPSHPLPYFPLKHLGLSLVWLLIVFTIILAPDAGHVPSFAECAPYTAALRGWM